MSFKLAVLAIDGGGIKGIVPAIILAKIEEITGRKIHELFDLIAGTSTGGILALGLTKPNQGGTEAEFSAENLVKLYTEKGGEIFEERKEISYFPFNSLPIQLLESLFKSLHFHIKFLELFESKYKRSGKDKVLKDRLGETLLNKALTEVLIISYEGEKRVPFLFTSNCAKENLNSDYFLEICSGCEMYDAAMATSAAPTFFKSHPLQLRNSKKKYTLIDGGVIANNPTPTAIVEAMKSYDIERKSDISLPKISLPEILVVSLGTGRMTDPLSAKETDKWGLIKWVKPLINIVLSGQSEVIDYQMDHLLLPEQYYRFQLDYINRKGNSLLSNDDDVDDAMDNTKPENIKNIETATKKFLKIEKVQRDLEKLKDVLIASLETRELRNKKKV
ncbi:patatin-like phospholipase family protein [Nostocaceae cyanobacterium CENA369]|uniref:Patatin-like phospholipase family protein n=1 Tax=Dendronalium phyllosphericum CENA369 TaxID=1725256 RepID=A0A8J7I2E9_9NOST|nr:patatin-like phospholipase family protein [Dendronalium phyllosphericum]MBH8572393.1 patatin-like phospholipase family protein [Dendronalium phyllosphericum CENA369]